MDLETVRDRKRIEPRNSSSPPSILPVFFISDFSRFSSIYFTFLAFVAGLANRERPDVVRLRSRSMSASMGNRSHGSLTAVHYASGRYTLSENLSPAFIQMTLTFLFTRTVTIPTFTLALLPIRSEFLRVHTRLRTGFQNVRSSLFFNSASYEISLIFMLFV